MLYICTSFAKVSQQGFRVTDLDIRVNARVVATVDGLMYGRTNRQATGSLYHTMPEAGATKIYKNKFILVSITLPFDNLKLYLPNKIDS